VVYPGNVNGSIGRIVATDTANRQGTTGVQSWCEDYISPLSGTFYADVLIGWNYTGAATMAAFNY
jgi:hypothetical protein